MSFKYQKRKTVQIIIISFCCVALLISGIIGAIYFFRGNNKKIAYGDIDYNCFTEGFTDVHITDEESAIEAVGSIADILGIKDVNKELKVVSVNNVSTDKYYRMQQYYDGIPVYGRTIVLSADKNNNATALTSNFICITDDISLEPTVTQKELEKSVQNYFDNDALTISIDDSNLVIYQKENGVMVLCYELVVLSNRVVIDANTAEILMVTDLYVQDMVECEYKDGSFQGIKISDNNYLLGNEEKGIFVFNANYNPVIKAEVNDGKTTYISVPENSLPMTSTDNYFGNNDSFAPEEYAKAVYMLNTLQSIANYYEEINAEQNTSVIVTINDSFDPDNAFGGYDDIINVTNATIPYEKENIISIFFGQDLCNDIYGNLDILGHEYMHGINHNFLRLDKNESSAIDEAYADIFGELSEALIKKQSPNWIHGQRNMVNPHEYDNAKYPYPASINDLENAKTFTDDDGALWYYTTANSGTDFSHFASTIISHCAYLMWNGIDGTEAKKINSELLAKLWYRSLLYLQSDADFSQCRNAVELSARTMLRKNEITEEQYQTVISAFEEVGIENATFTFIKTVKNSFDLSVLSSDGTEDVNYKLEVIKMPRIITGPGIKNNQVPKTIMEKTSLEGRQHLDLEDGTYVLRLTDVSDDRNISQAIYIKIVVNGNNASAADEVIINTDFTDVIVVVLNENSSEFAGGSGTEEDPYQVSTPEQLNAVRNNLSAHYIQTKDIDLSGWDNWIPIGVYYFTQTYDPYWTVDNFSGVYDGNGHSINNLEISIIDTDENLEKGRRDSEERGIGLFAFVKDATLKNISIVDSKINIEDTSNVTYERQAKIGGLVAYVDGNSEITNCSVTMDISSKHSSGRSDFIGGIVSICEASSNLTIKDCRYRGNITITNIIDESIGIKGIVKVAGGIIACGDNALVESCENTGNIIFMYDEEQEFDNIPYKMAGGIVGEAINMMIRKCSNKGNIITETAKIALEKIDDSEELGGIIGYCAGCIIDQCYNSGIVKGGTYNSSIGGIVGEATCLNPRLDSEKNVEITNCYNTGEITGIITGGIVGWAQYSSSISLSYNVGKINGVIYDRNYYGSIVGEKDLNATINNCYCLDNGIPPVGSEIAENIVILPADSMKKQSSFGGFDFEKLWGIDPTINAGYPYLK